MTVVETLGFLQDATAAITDKERTGMIAFLALAGAIMPGTGGGRKLRWSAEGRGKRGGLRIIYYFHNEFLPLFLLAVFAKNEKADLTKTQQNEMKKVNMTKPERPSGGSRIIASLREAVDWVEGKGVAVRVTQVDVPMIDVKATRRRLGLSQAAFAAKFGFQPATLKNWEQGRTYPDGPARVLLAVIARNPEAVEEALR